MCLSAAPRRTGDSLIASKVNSRTRSCQVAQNVLQSSYAKTVIIEILQNLLLLHAALAPVSISKRETDSGNGVLYSTSVQVYKYNSSRLPHYCHCCPHQMTMTGQVALFFCLCSTTRRATCHARRPRSRRRIQHIPSRTAVFAAVGCERRARARYGERGRTYGVGWATPPRTLLTCTISGWTKRDSLSLD
jgi:hypothetical protein